MTLSKDKSLNWHFDNTYSKLPGRFYTRMLPIRVSQPALLVMNYPLAEELGLNINGIDKPTLAEFFSGNRLPEGAEPMAQAYAGHQFGHFTYLGDGRAHLIGEHITPVGKRVDIQFKGSGLTPYGRRGDGRAALGPMLREYLISEAMNKLGIPTTRSLAVVTSGESVQREKMLPGAILTRVAASHIRVGTFEYIMAEKDLEGLKQLADYTINRHYPDVKNTAAPYLNFLKAVIARQVDLIINWMRVGFIHGVMNTDNMAISGETIDYGPCAFMDAYHPATVFSSIDTAGRYSYANQPLIAFWNLTRFAETLLPLLHSELSEAIAIAKELFADPSLYYPKWLQMMRSKLGLGDEQVEDEQLIADLLTWMQEKKADYTNTFLDLGKTNKPMGGYYEEVTFKKWYERWLTRRPSYRLMQMNNPAIIPRNHLVEKSLNAALKGDMQPFNQLLEALSHPYTDSSRLIPYQSPPNPDEAVFHTYCGT